MEDIFPHLFNLTDQVLPELPVRLHLGENDPAPGDIIIAGPGDRPGSKGKLSVIRMEEAREGEFSSTQDNLSQVLSLALINSYHLRRKKIIQQLDRFRLELLSEVDISQSEKSPGYLDSVFEMLSRIGEVDLPDLPTGGFELLEGLNVYSEEDAWIKVCRDSALRMIPIRFNEESICHLVFRKDTDLDIVAGAASLLETMPCFECFVGRQRELELHEMVLAGVSIPVAMVSGPGELLYYNGDFSALGIYPQKCLEFRDGQVVETPRGALRVRKILLKNGAQDKHLFFFMGAGDVNRGKRGDYNELGIISSSIAHELNNPLAGILAGLSFLEIQDEGDIEIMDSVRDMRDSARRSKDLVEIFLGFSRYDSNSKESISLHECLSKAVHLLRFRMIESNVRLQLDGMDDPVLSGKRLFINPSVLTIVLYQLLSDLLTLHSHEGLVTNSNTGILPGRVEVSGKQLAIILPDGQSILKELKVNKLVKHLLVLEGIELLKRNDTIFLNFGGEV